MHRDIITRPTNYLTPFSMTEITPSVPPPSLQDIEREDDGLDEDQKKRDELERSFWTKLWQGLSIASGVLAIAAMAIEGSAVCIVAGIVAIAVAGAVFKYQWDLEDTDSESTTMLLAILHIFSLSNLFFSI